MRSVLLDESLFADGAGTYVMQFELKDLSLQFNTPTLYIDLYDVGGLDGGGSVDVDSYFAWSPDYFSGLHGIVGTNAPATVSVITNLSWVANAVGIKTAQCEYDGSGDVLVNIGASKPDTVATDWWQIHIDDFIIHGQPASSAFELWTRKYGLSGADAASTYDYEADGEVNLVEYALVGNPTNAIDTGHPIQWEADGGGMHYVYPRRKNSALTYSLEMSTNLVSGVWTGSGYVELPGRGYIDAGFEAVTNVVPLDAIHAFIRLRIEE